jgi:DNA (cytosine-5)-methyltransferase 1
LGSIEHIKGRDLPDADISWASFPCQDLSLAGAQAGLRGRRSGLVWEWLRIYDEMPRKPRVLVAENVVGLLSSHGGANYQSLHSELVQRSFKVGALVLDAADFVPQSRPRVFVVACRADHETSDFEQPLAGWPHTRAVLNAGAGLPNWVFWKLPAPATNKRPDLSKLIDWDADADTEERVRRNLGMMAPLHQTKLLKEMATGFRVAPAYKRTRAGKPVLELRFDGLAGCLRTPEGGSSRQLLVLKRDGVLATRLLTARETARLMGAPESYRLPANYNEAYKAMGDAVAVPVARFLAAKLLRPLCDAIEIQSNRSPSFVRSA